MRAASPGTRPRSTRPAIRRCQTNGCSMPSYTIQESGFCRTCEKKKRFTEQRRRSQQPVATIIKASQKESEFSNTLSKSYKQITKRDGSRVSVSMPRESSSFSEGRAQRRRDSLLQNQQRDQSLIMGSPLSKIRSAEYSDPRAETPRRRLSQSTSRSPPPPPPRPPPPGGGGAHRPLIKSPVKKSSFNNAPEKRSSLSLTNSPGVGIRKGISFEERPEAQRCRTKECDSASYLLQDNGYCTACNTKAKVMEKLAKVNTNPESNNSTGGPLNPINTNRSAVVTPAVEEGSAFGGRLSYNFVRKSSQSDMPQSSAPSAKVVDYQYLRLKFLLNKAIAKGVDMMEVFEHFDTDFSGEVDFNEFNDGLKRLGIYLTHAESKALLGRFQASGTGSIPYKDFFTSLNLDLPAGAMMQTSPKSILKSTGSARNLSFREAPEISVTKPIVDDDDDDDDDEPDTPKRIVPASTLSSKPHPSPIKGRASPGRKSPGKSRHHSPGRKATSVPKGTPSPSKQRAAKAGPKVKDMSEEELVATVTRVQKEMLRLAKSKHGLPKFRKVFASMDDDGNGEVSAEEFMKILRTMGFELDDAHLLQILNVFDTHRNGSIEYDEFLKICESGNVVEAIKASNSKKKKKGTKI